MAQLTKMAPVSVRRCPLAPRGATTATTKLRRRSGLDNRTFNGTLGRVKTIPITELRQRAADVLDDAANSDEPTVVLQRSRKAAYIVGPEKYEHDQAELKSLRRALFLAEVREAETEYGAGGGTRFDDVEALLDELRS